MTRRKSLKELEETARQSIRPALVDYILPRDLSALTLGCLFDGDDRIFSLYLAQERPEDAIFLAKVRVNSISGEAGPVEVYLSRYPEPELRAAARWRLVRTLGEIGRKRS